MSQWKNDDSAANSVLWGVTNFNLAPNTANRDALFGNTTANAFVTGQTVGQYGVAAAEVTAARAAGLARPAHSGFVLRTEGSGGRAGRITQEVLVAGGSLTGDASDDAVFADRLIVISTQPANATANSTNNDIATFSVVAATVPAGGTLTYQWQANTGSGYANLSNDSTYSNTTNATLSVASNTATNASRFRALVLSTGANTVTSANARITITT